MSLYDYLMELRRRKQSPVSKYLSRIRMWQSRQNKVIHEVVRPTFLDKARKLGFKQKEGVKIYSVRIKRGGRPRKAINGKVHGKPRNTGIYQRKSNKSHQAFAEIRVGRKYFEERVLNSYWVGQDLLYKYFEVITVDPSHNSIRMDRTLNWLCMPGKARRETRGLTHATRTSRSLGKSIRYNQSTGGSRSAKLRKTNTVSLKKYR